MKDKRIIRMPKRHVVPPPGYFLAQIGDQIYCFDIEGNKKPPANSPCQNLDFPEGRNLGGFGRTLSEREDLMGELL